MAITSSGSSTTQILVRSREGSLHIEHGSSSVMLKHEEQNTIRSFMSRMASARACACSLGLFKRKKASLAALLGPTPGSLFSSSINLATGSTVVCILTLHLPHHSSLAIGSPTLSHAQSKQAQLR